MHSTGMVLDKIFGEYPHRMEVPSAKGRRIEQERGFPSPADYGFWKASRAPPVRFGAKP